MKKIIMILLVCMGLGLVGCSGGYENKSYYSEKVDGEYVGSSEMTIPFTVDEVKKDFDGTILSGINDIFKSSNSKKYDFIDISIKSNDGVDLGVITIEKNDDGYAYSIVMLSEVLDIDVKTGIIK